MRHAVVITALLSLLSTAAFGQAASPTVNQVTVRNGGIVISPPLHADGVTSDDAILKAAIDECASRNGTVMLPPGNILLTGTSTITIQNCSIVGVGVTYNAASPSTGTTILLTSTTVKPFVIISNFSVSGVNFVWPNQNSGTTVYPPLFSDDGVHGSSGWHMDNVNIVNAYDGISQTVDGPSWGDIFITNSNLWAVHDMFQLSVIGDNNHFSNLHLIPTLWNCGGVFCTSGINAAFAAGNTAFHVRHGAGNVQFMMDNTATFAWRNLIKVDANSSFGASELYGTWDGIGTMVDASASGAVYPIQARIGGGGGVCGISSIPFGGGGYPGNNPCFIMGDGNSGLQLDHIDIGSNGDLVQTSGAPVIIRNSLLSAGAINDGGTYALVKTVAGNPEVQFTNNRSTGANTAHGIYGTARPSLFNVSGNYFLGFADEINVPSPLVAIVSNNSSATTSGSASVVFQDITNPISWSTNRWDKPPLAAVSSCGAGATITGTMAGIVQIGSTTPTTSCTVVLPFFVYEQSCTGIGTGFAVSMASTGPNTYLFSFGSDAHGQQLFYVCANGS